MAEHFPVHSLLALLARSPFASGSCWALAHLAGSRGGLWVCWQHPVSPGPARLTVPGLGSSAPCSECGFDLPPQQGPAPQPCGCWRVLGQWAPPLARCPPQVSPGVIANPFAAGIGRRNSLESISSIDRELSPEGPGKVRSNGPAAPGPGRLRLRGPGHCPLCLQEKEPPAPTSPWGPEAAVSPSDLLSPHRTELLGGHMGVLPPG